MYSTECLPITYMASSVVLWLCVLMSASPIAIMSWAEESSKEHPCQESEKAALLAFYNFSGFDGLDALWPSANRTMYCACEWDGVECDEQGFIVSLWLDGDGEFKLNKSAATVPWPRLLAPLRFLEELYMTSFYHESPLPPEVGLLSQSLTDLWLEDCKLMPPLPAEALSNLSKLTTLELSYNNWNSPIPQQICNISSLQNLYLSWNSLTRGDIPPCIFSLSGLDLSHNTLQGSIPDQIWTAASASNRTYLSLSHNSLSGSIPESMGELLELIDLDLSSNSFTGSIPASLGNLTKLRQLILGNNMLSGKIPHQLGNLGANIFADVGLYLSSNQVSVDIDISAEIVFSGTKLDLSSNNFTGALPWTLLTSSAISRLNVHSNHITGITPYDGRGTFALRSGANTSSLERLDLSSNHLKGAIPSGIGHLSALKRLDLSDNLLESASFEDSRFPNFTRLQVLSLGSNNLQDIPSWLWSLPAASSIDLSMNRLRGDIWLDAICALESFDGSNNYFTRIQIGSQTYNSSCNLTFLDLHSNQLSGLLPWHKANNITDNVFRYYWLSLADNFFSGTLPEFRYDVQSAARNLDLSRNLLSGTIPTSISRLGLYSLRLSSNNFSGEIPSSLCTNPRNLDDFRGLGVLRLDNNSLSGSIPHDLGLCNATLQSVVLRNNMLTGSLPNWELSNLTKSLVVLDLSHNRLQGGIPGWVLQMQSLRVLILSHNAFSGALPAMRWNTTQLQVLDLSSNKLSGGIPGPNFSLLLQGFLYNSTWAASGTLYDESIAIQAKGQKLAFTYVVKATVSLDLSENALTGAIPTELGSLDGLIFLNLSHNRLTGAIPASLGKLQQLNSLDLSGNELEGEIPSEGLCSLTFLEFVNLSHNRLSGPIPQCPQWTTFSPESFRGNSGLCGPLSEQQQSCNPEDSSSAPSADTASDDEDNHEFWSLDCAPPFRSSSGSAFCGVQSVLPSASRPRGCSLNLVPIVNDVSL